MTPPPEHHQQESTSTTTSAGVAPSSQVPRQSPLSAAFVRPPTDTVVVMRPLQPDSNKINYKEHHPPPLPPLPPLPDRSDDDSSSHRAIHRIHLKALEHNYACVEAAANRQRCSVIVVVKADGYGHGAISTALHLADACGAEAFAVATLEEGIALRRAFASNPPGHWSKEVASLFQSSALVGTARRRRSTRPDSAAAAASTASSASTSSSQIRRSSTTATSAAQAAFATARVMRPTRIRIVVLGPPVGFPRCLTDYYHHNIELGVSGPEVAQAVLRWVADGNERKRTQVELAATETKAAALSAQPQPRDSTTAATTSAEPLQRSTLASSSEDSYQLENLDESTSAARRRSQALPHPSYTVGNVQGQDLVREVRAILLHQNRAVQAAEATQQQQQAVQAPEPQTHRPPASSPFASHATSGVPSSESSVASPDRNGDGPHHPAAVSVAAPAGSAWVVAPPKAPLSAASSSVSVPRGSAPAFVGIEAAAKTSRHRAVAAQQREAADTSSAPLASQPNSSQLPPFGGTTAATAAPPQPQRQALRWHALVDTGMGRLGFRTEPVPPGENRLDAVTVIKELVDAEIHANAPIEFMGMFTHMADANSSSDYTHSQVAKFSSLLKRVRASGIFVPTVSTDNSAALLTTSLTHFDPEELLSQRPCNTRGYVRTGGAVYGQRPAFSQLRAVSTLLASVRHVAVLQCGETVGYDRAYTAPFHVKIATLTIGFADGYPRELGNGVGKVAIRGAVFPVAGNICMDMMMVELGPADDKDGAGAGVTVGDTAVLWGPLNEDDGEGLVRLQDVASTLKTTQSALTCGLDKIRVRRQFV